MKKRIPDIIYLQLDEDGWPDTWARDDINSDDIIYTRLKDESSEVKNEEKAEETSI